jgi:hypothetical protein
MPLDILCRVCGQAYYETNDSDGFMTGVDGSTIPNPKIKRYNPEKRANGAMFRLKPFYQKHGWMGFPYDITVIGDALECCGCGSPLSGFDGRVKTRPQNGDVQKQEEPAKIVETLPVSEVLKEGAQSGLLSPDQLAALMAITPDIAVVAGLSKTKQFKNAKPNDAWTGTVCGHTLKRKSFYDNCMQHCKPCLAEKRKLKKEFYNR